MDTNDIHTNPPTESPETQDVTVSVPVDRVEQFNAFVERFLAHSGRRGRGGPGEGGPGRGPRGPRGRRGSRGRRARHLRRAMFHLAMAQHAGDPGGGACRHHRSPSEGSEATAV